MKEETVTTFSDCADCGFREYGQWIRVDRFDAAKGMRCGNCYARRNFFPLIPFVRGPGGLNLIGRDNQNIGPAVSSHGSYEFRFPVLALHDAIPCPILYMPPLYLTMTVRDTENVHCMADPIDGVGPDAKTKYYANSVNPFPKSDSMRYLPQLSSWIITNRLLWFVLGAASPALDKLPTGLIETEAHLHEIGSMLRIHDASYKEFEILRYKASFVFCGQARKAMKGRKYKYSPAASFVDAATTKIMVHLVREHSRGAGALRRHLSRLGSQV